MRLWVLLDIFNPARHVRREAPQQDRAPVSRRDVSPVGAERHVTQAFVDDPCTHSPTVQVPDPQTEEQAKRPAPVAGRPRPYPPAHRTLHHRRLPARRRLRGRASHRLRGGEVLRRHGQSVWRRRCSAAWPGSGSRNSSATRPRPTDRLAAGGSLRGHISPPAGRSWTSCQSCAALGTQAAGSRVAARSARAWARFRSGLPGISWSAGSGSTGARTVIGLGQPRHATPLSTRQCLVQEHRFRADGAAVAAE